MHCRSRMRGAHLQDGVSDKFVARTVCSMEVDGAAQEGEEERVAGVGVFDAEGWVLHQLLNILQVPGHIGTSLSCRCMLVQCCEAPKLP